MKSIRNDRFRKHAIGNARTRRTIVVPVIFLLVLASGGFLLGLKVGLSVGWVAVALGIAVVAGWIGTGIVPTIGSLWLIGFWWFVFPPLVGYLSGGWEVASRYSHPRMMGFGYTSARAELLGGLDYGVKWGFLFAVIGGTLAYLSGTVINRLATRREAQ